MEEEDFSTPSDISADSHYQITGSKAANTRAMPKLDGDLAEPGAICEVKMLYNHSPRSGSGSASWSIHDDPRMEQRRLQDLISPYAIVHRVLRQETEMEEAIYVTHSIEVNNVILRNILAHVFRGYPDWNSLKEPFTFKRPFLQFFHRWEALRLELSTKHDEVKIMMDVLKRDIQEFVDAYNVVKDTGLVSFDKLSLIFAPGEEALFNIRGHLCACKLTKTEYLEDKKHEDRPRYLLIHMEQLDWNGSYCGFRKRTARIEYFSDSIPVTKLDTFPFKLAGSEEMIEGIQRTLEERGRRFAALRGFHVRKCIGKKYVSVGSYTGAVEDFPRPVSWRVVIDAYAFYNRQKITSTLHIRRVEEFAKRPQYPKDTPANNERNEELVELTDEEHRLTVPFVRGFDLRTKEWCEFNIEELEDPGWSDVAYRKLVLNEGEKKLIMAFADRDLLQKRIFDDIVPNKGRGIIFLLCGSPGVGKTLTAEAVADKSESPLYILGANDIGTSENQVEEALENAFECCRLWDAVLLLDEADVFLEKRAADQLKRNELVSIFLRRLESYQGLMFLTTNRTEAIDDAFLSRMDLILRYPDLDEAARRQVWQTFLDLLPEGSHSVTKSEIGELAKEDVNGREIKSLIKTAHVLALRDSDGRLGMDHINVVLGIRRRARGLGSH